MNTVDGYQPAAFNRKPKIRPLRGAIVAAAFASVRPTGREIQIISLIAQGLSNKVIAYRLGISPHTVRCHISNILRKYHLKNRTQIAIYSLDR